MGDDKTVVDSARVSFNKDMVKGKIEYDCTPTDEKLIRYLAEHGHWSPFSHCYATFKIAAPVFVARQLIKHQVGLAWNEISRRYVDTPPDFWYPSSWRERAENKKQGSTSHEIFGTLGLMKNIMLLLILVKKLMKKC